jgi:2-octaprenyl-6-methoxyphenol hydroxylase
VVPIGNASQALHPVAGQGLNLGLRDAWAIARDWPATADAASEQRHVARRLDGRRLDRSLTIGATDALARLTAVDWLPMRVARGLGIAALDAVPAVRRQVLSTLVFGA